MVTFSNIRGIRTYTKLLVQDTFILDEKVKQKGGVIKNLL